MVGLTNTKNGALNLSAIFMIYGMVGIEKTPRKVPSWEISRNSTALIQSCCGVDLAEWLERLAVNAKVATVLCSIPVSSSDTVESEGRQMKHFE
jgi:hypothetical protein